MPSSNNPSKLWDFLSMDRFKKQSYTGKERGICINLSVLSSTNSQYWQLAVRHFWSDLGSLRKSPQQIQEKNRNVNIQKLQVFHVFLKTFRWCWNMYVGNDLGNEDWMVKKRYLCTLTYLHFPRRGISPLVFLTSLDVSRSFRHLNGKLVKFIHRRICGGSNACGANVGLSCTHVHRTYAASPYTAFYKNSSRTILHW